MEFHAGIAEENPGAAHVVVGGDRLGAEDHQAQGVAGVGGELIEQSQVHGSLRRLIRESGGGPDGNRATVRSENQGLGEGLCVDILK